MRRTRVVPRLVLALMICLGVFALPGTGSAAGNRCKDRCNDAYRLRRDVCRAIPLKHERKSCEKSAKRAKDDCKHRCR